VRFNEDNTLKVGSLAVLVSKDSANFSQINFSHFWTT